ncbi:hypothetical protein NDU88_006759 [Pleurodeles waltl]|uniref:Uncharacterized protein n=1 Tax=Pleurodeles waltl TaxID=8319 RepID=A0AAV7LRB2_PLEWA|nr:hypothetical protein NDU88_006729 [Pleurodeles waltl]KAJ1093637.1 hypothetical protein NDU88_006735 [Pleurodeles waltl]KAJ1093639.1 hypothetical protein NDU88_006737 [Pleurodeles waltl]KAJ1093645.1 hypothetical protein NDU88_006743 [Pleurodeles waltl]KAJ1093649.1 hypothetical protein NDU88_006747 [Pleurodeles waltl]
MGGPDPTVVGPQEPGSEPLSPARQGKTSGACGTPPRAHHGTGEGRRCAAGCWSSGVGPPPTPSRSSHPLPGRSFPSQGPQWAACGPGPAGSLRRHTSPPSPDRGRGFFGSGDKQPKAARQTDPALTDQSPVWTLPLPPPPPPGSPLPALHPGQERFSWSFTQGWPRTENRWGWAARESSPDCLHHTLGSGCCLWAGAFRPPGAPGRRGGLSPDHPTPALPTSLPACPGCPFFSTIKPPRSGGLQNPGGETKVGVSRPARPAGHLVAQPAGHLVARPSDQMARDDPGSAAGRQAGKPALDGSGRALALGGASQGQLASPAALAARGGISRSGHLVAPPTCEGWWDTPRPCTRRRRAGGGRPPCRAARVGCRSSGDARAGTTTTTTVHWGREWGGAAASARPLIISVPHGSEASGWPSAAPAGGDRPRRWAPEAVRAGSRGTPQTATRGTQPGAPGRARGGPASPARPPAEAGWRRLGAPAGVPPRQDPGAGGGRDPAAGDRGWSDLGVGGTKGAEATLRRPQPRPGKSPGAIDDRATLRQA